MTINVAVLTSEALVLSCDSNTGDGVTNLFLLQGGSCPVVAVTAGLAKLNNRSIGGYAKQFLAEHGGPAPVEPLPTFVGPHLLRPVLSTVKEVAQEFLTFMREHYDTHCADREVPEAYRDRLVFLLGGYDRDDHLPSLYRVNVEQHLVTRLYEPGRFGLAWEGQSDAVERLIRGYDSVLRASIENQFTLALQSVRKTIPWDEHHCEIAYGNLPLQDAVDLASFLVGMQSGTSKFVMGIPTVGGRTHVGVVTRHEGFRMLAEPELRHTHVGFVS